MDAKAAKRKAFSGSARCRSWQRSSCRYARDHPVVAKHLYLFLAGILHALVTMVNKPWRGMERSLPQILFQSRCYYLCFLQAFSKMCVIFPPLLVLYGAKCH